MTSDAPHHVTSEKIMRLWLWFSLLCNMGIIVTGAVVRVTGSGMGCPTWPRCSPESFVPHAELGIHGAIEFGNRTLTIVLSIAALGAFIQVWRVWGRHNKLWWITLSVGLGIIAQAVIGGLTVWANLHPAWVQFHLVVSIALIAICVWGLLLGYRKEPTSLPKNLRGLVVATFIVTMLSIVTGTLTTGAGPHAGDASSPRNGLDIEAIARVHALSAWLVVFFVAVCFYAFHRAKLAEPKRISLWLLAAVLLQGLIGYIQYFTGIPAGIVWLHLLGLSILTAVVSWLLFATKTSARA